MLIGSAAISADGRFVVFRSLASNLVPNDTNGRLDVFVRDRELHSTQRVNLTFSGGESIGDFPGEGVHSDYPVAISESGRFVAFVSRAADLVPGDSNGVEDVFVRDLLLQTTEIVSVSSGNAPANGFSNFGGGKVLSADGRYIMFGSAASNLVPNDLNGTVDHFVRDRASGNVSRVTLRNGGGQSFGGDSLLGSLDESGRLALFMSSASDLVANDTNNAYDAFLFDTSTQSTARVSVGAAGQEANDHIENSFGNVTLSLSGNGRFVVFSSHATNLVPNDTNASSDVFVRDRETNETRRINIPALGGQANGNATSVSVGRDARAIAFDSTADNIALSDNDGASDVFLVNDCNHATCGDAVLDFRCGESCDDGNLQIGDSCGANCEVTTPIPTPTQTPTATPTNSSTPTLSSTPTSTTTPSITPTSTAIPSPTPSLTPTTTPTRTATMTATATASHTPTATQTETATNSPSATPTRTHTATPSPICPPEPVGNCSAPGITLINIKANDDRDRNGLSWKWARGDISDRNDFGSPDQAGGTDYELCIYDEVSGVPALAMRSRVPSGGNCAGQPCWTRTASGFRYKERSGRADGIKEISLKAAGPFRSELKIKAAGFQLPLPEPASSEQLFNQDVKVTIQLVNNSSPEGACWGAEYLFPARRNSMTKFKDKEF